MIVAAAALLALSGCGALGQSKPVSITVTPAPAEHSTTPSPAAGDAAGELVFAATADDRHSWITVEARVVGITAEGSCEYTASAEGLPTVTRTAKALASGADTVCGDISFEAGTPGTYTMTVTVTGVTDAALTASADVEFLGSSAD